MIIGVSGIDGSGKTTLAAELAQALVACGLRASYERPQYLGNEAIKRWCVEHWGDPYYYHPHVNPDAYLGVVCSDWLHWWYGGAAEKHARGNILCVDRWKADTFALARLFRADRNIPETLLSSLPRPDIAIWLRVPQETANRRLDARNPPRHRLESREILLELEVLLETEFSDGSARILGAGGEPSAEVVEIARNIVLGAMRCGDTQ